VRISRGSGSRPQVVKVVSLFLIGMVILAMMGRLRIPGAKRLKSAKCKKCGRYRIGKGPCSCEQGD
jgi:hypothetical protein